MRNLVSDMKNRKCEEPYIKTLSIIDKLSDRMFGASVDAHVNKNRRRVLTAGLLGGGAFVVTKVLSSAIDMFSGDTVLSEKIFDNFVVKETGKSLSFFDRQSGEAILVIDK